MKVLSGQSEKNMNLADRPFALYPAMTWEHKNHLRLLEAVAYLRDSEALDLRIICTGFKTDFWPNIERRLNELGLNEAVKFPGLVPLNELNALYRAAQFVFVPTLFEAASAPVFEAWQHGAPVACSTVTSLPDQVADAALLFDPFAEKEIASALARMTTDFTLREDLRRRGTRRLKDFSLERTAKAYRAVYRRAGGRELSEEDRRLLAGDGMQQIQKRDRGTTGMTKRFIPVAAPLLTGNEKAYVLDCIESSWISSCGKYVEKFERTFADFCGVRYAVSCSSGTAALHVALLALGVGPGDEVIVPTLTFVATANAVTYCGARPRFVDIEPDTWTLDPGLVEAKITARTKAILPVHLYGHVANMDAITEIARRHNLFVVEDAAEAHGAEFRGRRVGSLSDVAAFSFYGNKIISCGEGGMVVTDSEPLARYAAQLRGQGVDSKKRYWFPIIGYNYRMPNLTAAVGLAQLERIDCHLNRRREVASWYRDNLRDVPGIGWQAPKDGQGKR